MKITAKGCRIIAPAKDPKNPRADKDGNVVLKDGTSDDIQDDKARELIRDGWAEKEGETARLAAAKAKRKTEARINNAPGSRRSGQRPGAKDRSKAALLGEELNGPTRDPDEN